MFALNALEIKAAVGGSVSALGMLNLRNYSADVNIIRGIQWNLCGAFTFGPYLPITPFLHESTTIRLHT
jgi:hypothetical protein